MAVRGSITPFCNASRHLAALRLAAPGDLELDHVAGVRIEADQDAPALPVRGIGGAKARCREAVRRLVRAGRARQRAIAEQLVRKAGGRDLELGLIDDRIGDVAQPELRDRHAGPGEAIAQIERLIRCRPGRRSGQGKQEQHGEQSSASRRDALPTAQTFMAPVIDSSFALRLRVEHNEGIRRMNGRSAALTANDPAGRRSLARWSRFGHRSAVPGSPPAQRE